MKPSTIKKNLQHYTAIFEPDAEAGGYTVTIPALPGCISEGDTFEEAQKNIQEAATLYLEVMRERKEEDLFQKSTDVIIAPIEIAV